MMRRTLLLWALVVFGQGWLWADPPARLGLPTDPSTPPPSTLSGGAAPGAVLPIVAPTVDPRPAPPPALGTTMIVPNDPYTGQPYLGYPISLPAAPGVPTGMAMVPALPMARPAESMPVSHAAGLAAPVDKGTMHKTGPCGPLGDCMSRCGAEHPLLDSLSIYFGLEGAHEPIDLGVNSRFGYRFHLNWGVPLLDDWNLGLHLGLAYNHGHNTLRILPLVEASNDIHQYFFTIGLFQRSELGINWEVAWDFREDDYYERFSTSQWRGLLSYNLNARNEVGVWGALRDRTDRANLGPTWFNVKPINQVNFFWRHIWDNDIVTSFWVGVAEEHGRWSLFGTDQRVNHPFIFGGDLFVPLSDRLALWGEAQFITPNDSGTVVATLGFAWYPWGRPATQPRSPFAPLLPAAGNPSFSLDAQDR